MKHSTHGPFVLVSTLALAACGGAQHAEPAPQPAATTTTTTVTQSVVRHAQLRDNRIEIDQTVDFEENSDALQASANALLDEVVHVLGEHAEIHHLRVEGNTDNLGTPEHNQTLSDQRAAAVARYLHEHGVAAGVTIDTVGYGATRPLCNEATDPCRARNRRVDFIVVDDSADAGAPMAAAGDDAGAAAMAAGDATDAGAAHHGGRHGHAATHPAAH